MESKFEAKQKNNMAIVSVTQREQVDNIIAEHKLSVYVRIVKVY